jgi:thiol-disulfide isomerase/thioredoxin
MQLTVILAVFVAASALVSGSLPPHGSRSASESKALHEDRRNTLHKPIPNVVDLKAEFFDKYIKPHHWKEQRARYWLVLFYSSWCLTCQDYAQPLRDVADKVHARWEDEHQIVYKQKELPRGQLSIGKHDATYGDVVALKYKVEGYPTLVLFDRDDDKKITTFEGVPSAENILNFIRRNSDVKV